MVESKKILGINVDKDLINEMNKVIPYGSRSEFINFCIRAGLDAYNRKSVNELTHKLDELADK
jgi:metal-responsive CopG/Arc/MetJ family transcriptional regulator